MRLITTLLLYLWSVPSLHHAVVASAASGRAVNKKHHHAASASNGHENHAEEREHQQQQQRRNLRQTTTLVRAYANSWNSAVGYGTSDGVETSCIKVRHARMPKGSSGKGGGGTGGSRRHQGGGYGYGYTHMSSKKRKSKGSKKGTRYCDEGEFGYGYGEGGERGWDDNNNNGGYGYDNNNGGGYGYDNNSNGAGYNGGSGGEYSYGYNGGGGEYSYGNNNGGYNYGGGGNNNGGGGGGGGGGWDNGGGGGDQPRPPRPPRPSQPSPGGPSQPSPSRPYQPSPSGPSQPSPSRPYQPSPGGPYQPSPGGPYQPSPGGPYQPSPDGPYQPSPGGPYQPSPSGPSQPGFSRPSQPAPSPSGSGNNGGSGIGSQPDPTPTVPSPVPAPEVAATSVCEAFASGQAPTSGPSKTYEVDLSFQYDDSVPLDRVLSGIQEVLNREVAADILGCSRHSRLMNRRLQDEGQPELTNVVFATPQPNSADCIGVDSSVSCLSATVSGTAFYTGTEPQGLRGLFSAAIVNADFSDVPGFVGFSAIREIIDVTPSPTPAPTYPPVDDSGISAVRGPASEPITSSKLSAGGFVGVAAAGLAVALLILFASRNKRGSSLSESDALKHRQFTADDESDGLVSGETGDAQAYSDNDRLVHIVGEDNSVLRDNTGTETFLYAHNRVMAAEGASLAEHSCSSPNCEICEQRRQNGVNFVPTGDVPSPDRVPLNASRSYISSDTVTL